MVPAQELVGSLVNASTVEKAQKRGVPESGNANIVGKANERIELVLSNDSLDERINLHGEFFNASCKRCVGLFLRPARAHLDAGASFAPPDCPDAASIEVRG